MGMNPRHLNRCWSEFDRSFCRLFNALLDVSKGLSLAVEPPRRFQVLCQACMAD